MIMDAQSLLEAVVAASDIEAQRQLLAEHQGLLDDAFAELLKQQSNHYLRVDGNRCNQFADLLLYQSTITDSPTIEALGWIAKANYHIIGLGEYQKGLDIFNRVDELYESLGLPIHKAKAQPSKLAALAFLGQYTEALAIERWAAPILEQANEWKALGTLTMNLAALLHGRLGHDLETLRLLDRAGEVYQKIEHNSLSYLAMIEQNRSQVLRTLGRFDESKQSSQRAYELLMNMGQVVEAARAQQSLAVTHSVLGQYNHALQLLDKARDVFLNDGRVQDVFDVDFDLSTCLLQLRRFQDVLHKCQQIRDYFSGESNDMELGRALLNEATAYASLHQYEKAVGSLQEAQSLFEQEGSTTWVALVNLELAIMRFYQGNYVECQAYAQSCATTFHGSGNMLQEAHAKLIDARATVELMDYEKAEQLLEDAFAVGTSKAVPALLYQCYALMGRIATQKGELQVASTHYERAIQELEQLRGQLMVEFRSDFLEDKTTIYEELVSLFLQLEQPDAGLQYVEQAKSRALLDLIANRLDLRMEPKSEEDRYLVDTLKALQSERNRLYRLGVSQQQTLNERGAVSDDGLFAPPSQELLVVEQQITELWHRLLVRNADYAGDAALWEVRTEPIQPYLDSRTCLLEYFIIHDTFYLFVVTTETVTVHELPVTTSMIQKLLRRLWLNLRMVPMSHMAQLEKLTQQAKEILTKFYRLLLAPVGDELRAYSRIYIVPYGPLHYLPFHAFMDDDTYLLEQHQFCYLPSGSMLHYLQETKRHQQSATQRTNAVFGYSNNGQLPQVVPEADAIADLLNGKVFLEDAATQSNLHAIAPDCHILHLSTHGDFRADNPLFSGLTLADGTLTTLDIFDLPLNASLITLSACQTGRNVVGGGDELLGLMRAFLAAGANSLLLSMWPVEDRSTQQLMELFYTNLKSGTNKSDALHTAQRYLMGDINHAYRHPYFWAPFFLVGSTDPLFRK